MRQFGAFLFVLFLPLSSHAARGTLCVQTFNAYATAYASNVSSRLDTLAEELLREPCDAIQLQELWQESSYTRLAKSLEPARLASLRADTTREDKKITGIASFAKGSFTSASSELYSVNNEDGFLDWIRDKSGVQKGFSAIRAKLDVVPETVLLLNTHTHPTNEAIRVAQMVQLADAVLTRLAPAPTLFAADTNAVPESLELEILQKVLLLKDSFLEANGTYAGQCTYCGKNPLSWDNNDRVIDYVLFRNSPALAWRAERADINLKGTEHEPLSDHYGMRSILGWEEREPELLFWDDARVGERRHWAATTMGKAAALLEGQRKPVFRAPAAKARELEKMLRMGPLTPAADVIFRTP